MKVIIVQRVKTSFTQIPVSIQDNTRFATKNYSKELQKELQDTHIPSPKKENKIKLLKTTKIWCP